MKFSEAVGGPVLETLTAGIYDGNSNCIREYVQNAGDSGTKIINVVTQNKKNVIIRDYGEGMNLEELFNALNLGKSNKSQEQSGWRGIGIYSGISNFRRIYINTKKEGGNKLHVEIDCEKMRSLYAQKTNISDILEQSISDEIEDVPDSGFQNGTEVVLSEVLPNQDFYFQDNEIRNYLISNVPLPMAKSDLSEKILNALKNRGVNEPKHELFFNGEKLFRHPQDTSLFLEDSLSVKDFKVDNKIVATAWVVFNKDNKELKGPLRGLVFKKKGFTIGDPNTVSHLHLGSYNFWSYGEIHILDPEIKENAGRNNFEINSGTTEKLIVLLKDFLNKLQQSHRYKSQSDRHSDIEKARKYIAEGDIRKASIVLKKARKTMGGTQKPPDEPSLSGVSSLFSNMEAKQKEEVSKIEAQIRVKKSDESEMRIDGILSQLPSKKAADIRKKLSDKSNPHELFAHPMKELSVLLKRKINLHTTDMKELLTKAFYPNFSDNPNDIKTNAKLVLTSPEKVSKNTNSSGNSKNEKYIYYITGGLGHAIMEFYNIFVNGEKHYDGGLLGKMLEGKDKETKARAYFNMYALIDFLTLLVELSEENGSRIKTD